MKTSAGVLLFRKATGGIEVLLVHPGGPFWAGKDAGAWSVPKGEVDPGEEPRAAALRELREETGCAPAGTLVPLTPVRQRGGKLVLAWAAEGDCDALAATSNTVTIEWPPRSGRRREFPEIDRAEWFPMDEARRRILPAQAPLLEELAGRLAGEAPPGG